MWNIHFSRINQRKLRVVFYQSCEAWKSRLLPRQFGTVLYYSASCFFPGQSWTATRGQGGRRGLVGQATPPGFSQVLRLWAGWQATPWGELWPDDSIRWPGPLLWECSHCECSSSVLSSDGMRKVLSSGQKLMLLFMVNHHDKNDPHRLITINPGPWPFKSV